MTGRARKILSRFPAHLEPARPGKLLGEVVDDIARDLDAHSAALAAIRRSHRLDDTDELRDLLLIAALHGIDEADLSIAYVRFLHAAAAIDTLAAAGDAAERADAAEALLSLWGIAEPAPRLPLYAPPPAPGAQPDLAAAAKGLEQYAQTAVAYSALLEALQVRVARIAWIHARGNGTPRALLEGAANALDLDIDSIYRSEDCYWHAALVYDRLRIGRPGKTPFSIADEVLGIEENPLWRDRTDPLPYYHGYLPPPIRRRGFERALLQVRITGVGDLTVGPMLVNRDEGHGVGFAGAVPDGETLVFTEEGRVLLEGADVTSLAYAWKGACFAGDDADATRDFVLDGDGVDSAQKPATFAQPYPAGALDGDFAFPHAGDNLPMPGLGIGETRLAFFLQAAHYSGQRQGAACPVEPRPLVGFLDGSVFASPPGETPPDAALVSLSWLEHRAFAVRLLIPSRFRLLTPKDPDGADTRQRVAHAVGRFRPVGIEVSVEFVDERWKLGEGVLTTAAEKDPIARLRGGTVLWPSPTS